MNIKKNDTVIVLSGKDKGVKGKVLVAMPAENKVIVEKVNVATCHTKPRKQGETGGIVKRETPIRTCKRFPLRSTRSPRRTYDWRGACKAASAPQGRFFPPCAFFRGASSKKETG